jgi:hypothetical protein
LGFTSLGTTYFDGSTMMYGLPVRSTPSASISLSYWLSPGADDGGGGPAQGCILGSPFMSCSKQPNANDTIFADQDISTFMNFNPYVGGGVAAPYSPGGTPLDLLITGYLASTGTPISKPPSLFVGQTGWTLCGSANAAGYAQAPDPNYDPGFDGTWWHVMISLHQSSGFLYATMWVNDDEICTDLRVSGDITSVIPNEPYLFPYAGTTSSGLATYPSCSDNPTQTVDPMVGPPNVWHIGGRYVDFSNQWGNADPDTIDLRPSGDGLNCAVTELWIAEGQYLDWSNATVRKKFHTTDALETSYLPVNLGSTGSRPTGVKPTMYYTGYPTNFKKNRVTGANASVYGDLTLDTRAPGV